MNKWSNVYEVKSSHLYKEKTVVIIKWINVDRSQRMLDRGNTIEMQANIIAYLATCEDKTAGWNRKVYMAIKGPTELFTGKL